MDARLVLAALLQTEARMQQFLNERDQDATECIQQSWGVTDEMADDFQRRRDLRNDMQAQMKAIRRAFQNAYVERAEDRE